MAGGARSKPASPDAGPSLRQVSAADQKHLPLDRERRLVDEARNASRQTARLPGHRTWRAPIAAMAEEADQEEPKSGGNRRQKAASVASVEQEAELCHRSRHRLGVSQRGFEPASDAENSPQGAAIPRPVERRSKVPIARGHAWARQGRVPSASRAEARKAPDPRGGCGLREARRTEAI